MSLDLINAFNRSEVGDLLDVKDVDLIIELDELAPKTRPQFLIKTRRKYRDGETTFVVLTLDHVGSTLEFILVGSIFGNEIDVKLFKRPDFFEEDRRDVIFNGDNGWLFDFDQYPQEIYSGDTTFARKVQPEVFGDTALIEWETKEQIINYKLLLIETGIHNAQGGWVEFYEGRQIEESTVKF